MACASVRVERRDDASGQRQARPGRAIDIGEDRDGTGRRDTVHVHRSGPKAAGQRIPPASSPCLAKDARHDHPSHQLDHLEGHRLGLLLRAVDRQSGIRRIEERLGQG